jgi:hypothetical protein
VLDTGGASWVKSGFTAMVGMAWSAAGGNLLRRGNSLDSIILTAVVCMISSTPAFDILHQRVLQVSQTQTLPAGNRVALALLGHGTSDVTVSGYKSSGTG